MVEPITIEREFLNADAETLPSEYSEDETLGQLAKGCQGNALAHLWDEHDVQGGNYSDIEILKMKIYAGAGDKEVVSYKARYDPDGDE